MHHLTLAVAPGWRPLATIVLAIPLALAGLSPGYAQPYGGNRYDDGRDGVRLYRQLSNNACRYNDTWGYDRRGVWVDNGCRAEFTLD